MPGPSLKANTVWFITEKQLVPEVTVAGVLSSYCKMEAVAVTLYLDLQIQDAKAISSSSRPEYRENCAKSRAV